jgi:hypothetical protein
MLNFLLYLYFNILKTFSIPFKLNCYIYICRSFYFEITNLDFEHEFKLFGKLKSVRVCFPKLRNSRSHAFGFVNYVHRSDAKRAMEYCINNHVWGVNLRCNWSSPPMHTSRTFDRRSSRFTNASIPVNFANSQFLPGLGHSDSIFPVLRALPPKQR